MKKDVLHSGICMVLLSMLIFISNVILQAQDTEVMPATEQDHQTVVLTCNGLTLVLQDSVRPTLGNCGKGLLHYDCDLIRQQDKVYLCKFNEKREKPVLVRATLSDVELEILKHNLNFIDKQYQIQIKEWIRDDRWDLNLGEAIKGFYMKPVFE
jgi:hypothetical protein